MSSEPESIPQDAWTQAEKAAREDKRRRADDALDYIRQHFAATNVTKVDPTVAEIRTAKIRAIDREDFETAAKLRDIEKRLLDEK